MNTTTKHQTTANAFKEAADLMRRQRDVATRVEVKRPVPDAWEQRLSKALSETGQRIRRAR